MAKLHVKKGDKVKVIAGKDKGKEGVILRAFPKKGRVAVEKVNMIKKTVRPTPSNPQGGITTVEGPIDASNVQLVCPSCKKATRVNRVVNAEGKKVRVCKKCGATIE
jgi:large subunit ribosomal protein L24